MDKNTITRLGLDIRHGVQSFSFDDQTFDVAEATDVLRKALIAANGGSAKFDWKSLRRNKVELFEIIEELVPSIIQEGLTGNEFWNNYVDYKNIAAGDVNEFYVDDGSTYIVTEVADGVATPRRQRIGKRTKISVNTAPHMIRIYDEFSRFMAGRIDWNELCDKVAASFQKQVWADIYTCFSGITASSTGLNSNYVKTGAWDEDTLLQLCADIEAATGKKPTIFGTIRALKKISTATISDDAKNSQYQDGYYGKFYGYDVMKLAQAHTPGTDNNMLSDSVIHVVAGDDKFIKFVDEGETYIDDRDYTANADLTLEYRMTQNFGTAIVFATKSYGKYTVS